MRLWFVIQIMQLWWRSWKLWKIQIESWSPFVARTEVSRRRRRWRRCLPRNRGIIKDAGNISTNPAGGATHTHTKAKGATGGWRCPSWAATLPSNPSQRCNGRAGPRHSVSECTELCCCCCIEAATGGALHCIALHCWKSGALGDFSATVLRHYCPVGTLCLQGELPLEKSVISCSTAPTSFQLHSSTAPLLHSSTAPHFFPAPNLLCLPLCSSCSIAIHCRPCTHQRHRRPRSESGGLPSFQSYRMHFDQNSWNLTPSTILPALTHLQ